MTHLLTGSARPLILAHRGASLRAPENTLAAFRLALEEGADGVELDAKLSADGKVVVMHDPSLLRTTGVRAHVQNLTLAELRTLDAGGHFSAEYQGEKIPTLAEVFDAVGKRGLIDVEITNYTTLNDGLVEKIARLVQDYGLQDSVFCTSFFPSNLKRMRRLLPDVPVGILAWSGVPGWVGRGPIGRAAAPGLVLPYYRDCSSAYVRAQRAASRLVIPWTVDDPAEARRLLASGVNGIITNDPLLMRNAMETGGED